MNGWGALPGGRPGRRLGVFVAAVALTLVVTTSGAGAASAPGPEVPVGAAVRGISAHGSAPEVAASSSGWLAVWQDRRGGADIFGTRITSAGAVVDAPGLPITATGGDPSVASDGSGWLVAWDVLGHDLTPTRVYVARVRADGSVAAARLLGDGGRPAVSFDGARYLVVWSGGPGASSGARVSTDGTVLDPGGFAVSDEGGGVALQSGGGVSLVAWTVHVSGPAFETHAVRIGPTGTVLDGEPLVLSSGGPAYSPAVSWDGTAFLVAWQAIDAVAGARVDAAGHLLGSLLVAAREG